MPEYRRGDLRRIVAEVRRQGLARTRRGLTATAAGLEQHLKTSLSTKSHPLGTPTPARKGNPPARISGTLARSVKRTPVRGSAAAGYSCQVGIAKGFSPPYSDVPSADYGGYLERDHNYPFMAPAARFARQVIIPQAFDAAFREWP